MPQAATGGTAVTRPARLAAVLAVLFAALLLPATYAPLAPAGATADPDRGFVAAGLLPAAESGERNSAYDNTMVLAQDGSVRITETITHVFPAGQERHGITRDIRVRAGYRGSEDVYRYYRLTDLTVSSPTGAPAQVQESDFGAYLHLRIGSPDETVTGSHTYVIAYTLANVVNEIDADSAEFVHDVVGVANEEVYDEITASIAGPGAATQVGCNYGEQGSDSLCTAELGDPARFGHSGLRPGEAMTVAVSMPRAAFGDLSPELIEDSTANEDDYDSTVAPALARRLGQLTAGLGLFLPLLAAAGMGLLVWNRGRDEVYAGLTPGLAPGAGEAAATARQGRSGTVAVQFTPPEGVQPGMVGTIIDERADTVDVTATVLDLAVRGYLTITETSKRYGRTDWLLTRLTPPASARALSQYEEILIEALFARGEEVRLSDLRHSFASTLTSVKGSMYNEVVRRGWFRASPESQRRAWTGFGRFLMLAGIVSVFFLRGFLPAGRPSSAIPFTGTTILGLGLVLTGLIVSALGKRMAARTADGSAVLAQSLGFRQYLVTAEANQIRFEEAQQIFSAFLPYAVVFGVADKWAETFQEVAAAAAASGVVITAPYWYIGTDFGSGSMFDSIASGADDFATQAAGTFISTPGSSGESVFSGGGGGFSGGGFSGGGFSGGGGSGSSGGSW